MKRIKLYIILFLGLFLIISHKNLAFSIENTPDFTPQKTKSYQTTSIDLADTPFSTPKEEEESSSKSDNENSEKEFEKDIFDLFSFQKFTQYCIFLFNLGQTYAYLTFSPAKFSLYLLDCAFLL